jgi:hypothetical protein
MNRQPKEPIPHEIIAVCHLCEPRLTFDGVRLLVTHLKEAHGDLVPVDAAGKSGLRQRGVQYLDAAEWYSNTYEIVLRSEDRVVGSYTESGPRGRAERRLFGEAP